MCGILVLALAAADDDGRAALAPFLPPLARRGPDAFGRAPLVPLPGSARLLLAASLLQVRGVEEGQDEGDLKKRLTACPLVASSPGQNGAARRDGGGDDGGGVDADGAAATAATTAAATTSDNTTTTTSAIVLCFNGEIYESRGGLVHLVPGASDGQALLGCLGRRRCGDEAGVVAALSSLRGPWALALWHAPLGRLFFGRDVFGRRSLLVRRRGPFALASVAPEGDGPDDWEELPPGVWSVGGAALAGAAAAAAAAEAAQGQAASAAPAPTREGEAAPPPAASFSFRMPVLGDAARAHPWADPLIERLRRYERAPELLLPGQPQSQPQPPPPLPPPRSPPVPLPPPPCFAHLAEARLVLDLLLRAVERRCATVDRVHKDGAFVGPFPPHAFSSLSAPPPPTVPPPTAPPPTAPPPPLLLPPSPVLVLFSGGVDSVLLAAAAHRALPPAHPIDLCNVCFDAPERRSPDRLAALDALAALRRWAPARAWRLLLADGTLADADAAAPRLRSLLAPRATVMDLNIGAALWMAARGVGTLATESDEGGEREGEEREDEQTGEPAPPSQRGGEQHRQRPLFCSAARVCLLGHGADEQHGGYGRHRTAWRSGGGKGEDESGCGCGEGNDGGGGGAPPVCAAATARLRALSDELALDVRRIWSRNLGRDDRLVADTGREARHPFLDEEFSARGALALPAGALVAFGREAREKDALLSCSSPSSSSSSVLPVPPDKRLLRLALLLLGAEGGGDAGGGEATKSGAGGAPPPPLRQPLRLSLLSPDNPFAAAARRDKRAIQFGTRLGKLCNVRDFGSNRRANARSAGSVPLGELPPPPLLPPRR